MSKVSWPIDWKETSINQMLTGKSLFSDGDWVESKDQDEEGSNRLIQLADVGDGEFLDKSSKYMNDRQFKKLHCTALKEGDILIARMPDPIGRSCIFPRLRERCATVVDVAILRNPNADTFWLSSMINSASFRREIENHSAGTTRTRITRWVIGEIKFYAPDIEVQKKISAILKVLDNAIVKTEFLIQKYQQIKAGLMHDLFTRGVTAEGKLRPPREQAPGLYQETALGWIPKSWQVVKIEDVANVIDPNPSHRNPIYHEQGFPFISTVEFIESDEIEIDTPRRVIEEIVIEQERRCKFSASSIAFSRKGTIAEIRFLPANVRFALLDSLCVINSFSIDPDFLFHTLRSDYLKLQIRFLTMGQALPQMSIGRVRALAIPCPIDNDEQHEVARRLGAVTDNIKRNFEQLRKLKQQKFGLVQDLLTGKVQVQVDQ